jgi:hypothetical protein
LENLENMASSPLCRMVTSQIPAGIMASTPWPRGSVTWV